MSFTFFNYNGIWFWFELMCCVLLTSRWREIYDGWAELLRSVDLSRVYLGQVTQLDILVEHCVFYSVS